MVSPVKGSLVALLLSLIFPFCISVDTISASHPIRDGSNRDVLISSGERFKLGFFSPVNSSFRYLGIWYSNGSEQTVVWVANRDHPIRDRSGYLTISGQGDLVICEKNGTIPVWSANVSVTSTNNSMAAQLLDSGNFVLVNKERKSILWQSFEFPTDTYMPNMKLGMDLKTGMKWSLSSWKSASDPGTGSVVFGINQTGYPQLFLYKNATPWWRGGPWTGVRWSGIPEMTKSYIINASFVNNGNEVSIEYSITNPMFLSRVVVDESGTAQRFTWNNHAQRWFEQWSAPKERCDYYKECGPNGNCDPSDPETFICKCLPGFEPKLPGDWYLRDGSGGCVRKAGVSTCGMGEGFVKLTRMKVPDTSMARANMNVSLKECEQECLKNCSCNAYTSADESGIGCLTWYGDLVDTRTFEGVGQDIYIRVDAAELAKYQESKNPLTKKGIQAILVVSITVTLFLAVCLVYWLIRRKQKAKERHSEVLFTLTTDSTYAGDFPGAKELDQSAHSDLRYFDLSVIAAATNNFSDDNKLGEGGFGAVYKGILNSEREIAVKRLSMHSGQGVEEFKNEVALIAKLQHRNLVRILGYCIKGQEKMLIYEYLPNKSLDSFIFDETKKSLLDWSMRHNIICGVARGILYLHQDSRLRIIHRDLKASNVLLDASMNPKISDFGMARIFGINQNEAQTNRVVGTYGYMSPEYAMQGLFSVKSDVYSFGVLLLEIITGRKNSSYYEESTSSTLVGYVWDLWREGRGLGIVDPLLGDLYPVDEVLRCIQIGLLCVQESATDRPTMSAVVFMLSNDTTLPCPKQPAFILRRTYNSGDPSSSDGANSLNYVTVTVIEAR